MQADIEIHKAAMSLRPQRRCARVVGARSELMWVRVSECRVWRVVAIESKVAS